MSCRPQSASPLRRADELPLPLAQRRLLFEDDFEPGGAPRPSVRRVITPPRVPRPPPPASVVMAAAPVASSIPMVPIPSDRDRAGPWEVLFYGFRRQLTYRPSHDRLGCLRRSYRSSARWFRSALFALRLGSGTTGRARVQRHHALHSPSPAGNFASRLLVVFPFPPAPSFFGGSGAGYQRPFTHYRRGHRSTRPAAAPPPCVRHATPGGSCGLFIE